MPRRARPHIGTQKPAFETWFHSDYPNTTGQGGDSYPPRAPPRGSLTARLGVPTGSSGDVVRTALNSPAMLTSMTLTPENRPGTPEERSEAIEKPPGRGRRAGGSDQTG